jgi:hypothetical protein
MSPEQINALDIALTILELAMCPVENDSVLYGPEELVIAAHSYINCALSGFHTVESSPMFVAKVYSDMALSKFIQVH